MRFANRSGARAGWGRQAPSSGSGVAMRAISGTRRRVLVLVALATASLAPKAAVAERRDEPVEIVFASAEPGVVYSVTLDSGESGTTPCTLTVRPGWRRLAVVHDQDSYEQDLFVWSGTRAMVQVGRREAVPATLLRIDFSRAGTLLVDGSATCETPCSILVAPGQHALEVPGQFGRSLFIRRNRQLRLAPGDKYPRIEAEPGPLPFSGPRLRLGGSLEWAPFAQLVHGTQESIMAFEGQVRLGVQFTENLAAYVQASALVGNTMRLPTCNLDGCSDQVNEWPFLLGAGALVEATFWHRVQVALGPALFVDPEDGAAGGGGMVRVGLVPEPHATSRRRWGFGIGLQGQFALLPNGSLWSVGLVGGCEIF